jgi:hypothetical protein
MKYKQPTDHRSWDSRLVAVVHSVECNGKLSGKVACKAQCPMQLAACEGCLCRCTAAP